MLNVAKIDFVQSIVLFIAQTLNKQEYSMCNWSVLWL